VVPDARAFGKRVLAKAGFAFNALYPDSRNTREVVERVLRAALPGSTFSWDDDEPAPPPVVPDGPLTTAVYNAFGALAAALNGQTWDEPEITLWGQLADAVNALVLRPPSPPVVPDAVRADILLDLAFHRALADEAEHYGIGEFGRGRAQGIRDLANDIDRRLVAAPVEDAPQPPEIYTERQWNETVVEVAALRAKLGRVEDVHKPIPWHYGNTVCSTCYVTFPCPTRAALDGEPQPSAGERPKIVTLCGSTRFQQAFIDANERLSHEGLIVLSVWEACLLRRPADGSEGKEEMLGEETARILDATYLHKIAMSDEIFVLNVGGYIDKSTAREIAHAQKLGKPVRYLECAPASPEAASETKP
jgi:hypothetical protein